jgi:exo-beta-1,3-glucanase (GH17 family)
MKTGNVFKKLCLLLAVFLTFTLLPLSAAAEAVPTLLLDDIPKYGVSGQIKGHVLNSTGSLAVTGYLQVSEGGTIWGPKPTYATPSVPVGTGGSFSLTFITGGSDASAVRLYVYLIPNTYTPTSDAAATEGAALDKLVVARSADGTVTILPREGKWVRDASAGDTSPGVTTPSAPPVQPSGPSNPNAGEPGISICYSPYTNNQNPEKGDPVPMEQMEWQLNVLYPYADTIRTFGVSGDMYQLYKTAKETYGYRIIAGCWLGAGYTESAIKKELDTLIDVANRGWCDIAVVGSECLYRGDFTESQLIGYIQYVKNGIQDKSIPVATSDTAGALLSAKDLVSLCDIVLATCYPFFEGVNIKDAAAALKSMYDNLTTKYPGKEVIISETGWPSQGSAEGAAVPSEQNAALYFNEVYSWSEANDIEIVYFSAFDEGWKIEGSAGDVGGHWGHFTSRGVLKEGYRAAYEKINPVPVQDAASSWAESEILDMIKAGYISPDGPAVYDPKVNITRGDFMHYLINALDPKVTYNPDKDPNFSDVDPMLYYADSIGVGRKLGIIAGTGNNECRPLSSITRQEEFTLIYRTMLTMGVIKSATDGDRAKLSAFADGASIPAYAVDAFAALVRDGIVKGGTGNLLNPGGLGTRAEAAVLIYRLSNT